MAENRLAPILLLAYNRPDHLAKTLDALKANLRAEESELYIYSDAPRNAEAEAKVIAVRAVIAKVKGFAKVTTIYREKNVGLANNVIEGVSRLVDEYGKVIVLEDDLITSPYFLTFMNDALDKYAGEEKVLNVNGHVLKTKETLNTTFFISFADSWGWATWKRAWDKFQPNGQVLLDELRQSGRDRRFDFDGRYHFTRMLQEQIEGKNNSWAIRWNATIFLNNGLSLNAGRSMVDNIGTDGSGTHFTTRAGYYSELYKGDTPLEIDTHKPILEDEVARRAIGKVFAHEKSKITKAFRLLAHYWHLIFKR